MIELTDAAISKAIERTSREGRNDIRLGVNSSGCAGYSYTIEFADNLSGDDVRIEYGKFSIIINKDQVKFFRGARLDWVKEGLNESFKIINPNETYSCGCGASVTFEE
jgi:iron-sulfur cluster assembly protein